VIDGVLGFAMRSPTYKVCSTANVGWPPRSGAQQNNNPIPAKLSFPMNFQGALRFANGTLRLALEL